MEKGKFFLILVLILSSCSAIFAQVTATKNSSGAEEEGLESLLFEEIPAILTKIDNKDMIPASVTTITSRQISATPARNIYDLIEVYVPGSLWLNHHESPHFGIRGIISDRNYKFLLLVNGRKVNQNAHSGGEAELENWDLNDIERIEIIRGPGSVIYGPGAIEGVVNIIIKSAYSAAGLKTGVNYVSEYDSKGIYASYGKSTETLNTYVYGSVTHTEGIDPEEYWTSQTGEYGYLGEGQMSKYPANEYFDDVDNDPQIKLQTTCEFLKEWKAWIRYTRFGTTRHCNDGYKTLMADGEYENLKQNRDQALISSLENVHAFTEAIELKSSLSYSNLDHERRQAGGDLVNKNSIKNILQNFSEEELDLKVLLNYTSDFLKVAGGMALAYESFGPGWGDSNDDFRMGDNSDIFGSAAGAAVAGRTSNYYIFEDGWNSYLLSYMGEISLNFNPRCNLILSGRIDDHEFADPEFSPRIAILSDWEDMGIFKLIGYESIRMNTEEQLKLANETDGKTDPESLKGLEFIYNKKYANLNVTGTLFYTETEIVGWSTTRLVGDYSYGDSILLGNLKLWGLEFETVYTFEKLTFGFNHSYCKQKEFELESGQVGSGISYADFDRNAGGGVVLQGTGNDLNNWANHATKLFMDYQLTEKDSIHFDTQIFWEYEGAKDGLEMLNNSVQGTSSEAGTEESLNALESKDVYEMNINCNLSYTRNLMDNLSINIFILNIFEDYKRYSYDTGLAKSSPYRTMWIEEPRAYGVKLDYKY